MTRGKHLKRNIYRIYIGCFIYTKFYMTKVLIQGDEFKRVPATPSYYP